MFEYYNAKLLSFLAFTGSSLENNYEWLMNFKSASDYFIKN